MKGTPRSSTFSWLTSAPLVLATHSELRVFLEPEQPVLVARAWLAVIEQQIVLYKSTFLGVFPLVALQHLPFPGALS